MEFAELIYRKDGPIAWIALNRPGALNALSKRLVTELEQAVDLVESDPEIRVAVLSGEGRAFSAGYDLKEEVADNPDTLGWKDLLDHDIRMTLRFWHCPKPVIAMVHGYCLAGACELAMCCDITIASEDAVFGEPEIRYGSGPVTLIMPYVLGLKKTKELLFTGDTIDAQEAHRLGMVNRVVPRQRLEDEVKRLARKIATVPPAILRQTKQPINKAYELSGFLQAVAHNLEASTILNAAQIPEQEEFDRIVREQGLKAALAWRDNRFGESL